jgi:hypothetical protein
MTATANNGRIPRRALTRDELHRILAVIREATDTRQLRDTTLRTLYTILLADAGAPLDDLPDGQRINPGAFAIPTTQWQLILRAATNRAQEWGTAAEIGLELALGLMPTHYDDPDTPVPEVTLPDYRPVEHIVTFDRAALDVIAAAEAYLAKLHTAYGATSSIYQQALVSWHRNLTAVLTMNTGPHTRVTWDGELSLFVRTSSGLVYGLIFHGATRHCTQPGCHTLIADDGTAHPAGGTGATVIDHHHAPSYPLGQPPPGTWSLHS